MLNPPSGRERGDNVYLLSRIIVTTGTREGGGGDGGINVSKPVSLFKLSVSGDDRSNQSD